jgi:hypothetical protein
MKKRLKCRRRMSPDKLSAKIWIYKKPIPLAFVEVGHNGKVVSHGIQYTSDLLDEHWFRDVAGWMLTTSFRELKNRFDTEPPKEEN